MFTEYFQKSTLMKTNDLDETNPNGNVWCNLFGHKFKTTKIVNEHFMEFECVFCKQQTTNNIFGKKISLTKELKEINNTLHIMHHKRITKGKM